MKTLANRDNAEDSRMNTIHNEGSDLISQADLNKFSNTGGFQLHSKKQVTGGSRIKVAVRIRPLLDSEHN